MPGQTDLPASLPPAHNWIGFHTDTQTDRQTDTHTHTHTHTPVKPAPQSRLGTIHQAPSFLMPFWDLSNLPSFPHPQANLDVSLSLYINFHF